VQPACYSGSFPTPTLNWTVTGSSSQTNYQVQIDNNSNFSSPEVNRDYSGLSNSSPTTNNQTVSVAIAAASNRIIYNTTYYWRVKVYDSNGADSGWVSGSSFITETHQYPLIIFMVTI